MTNTVAVERRMDLASLFCMIGRHGPAVALAVIAMVSVLVGFIIYRTLRRKATAAAAHSDGKSPGAERDASVIQASQEESHSSGESTDLNYEGSSDMSDMKEDVDLIQSDLKIRHRRAAAVAAEKKTPPYCPPKSGIQAPENKHTTSDDTEEMAVVWDSFKIAEKYAEETSQGLPDSYTVAEMVVEDTVDCHQGGTDIIEDVIEEVRDNDSCLKEPEPINNEDHEEEEKVLKAECQEDEAVATDKDVSDKKTRQEEEKFQSTLDSLVCFEQTPHMDEKDDDERLQDNKNTLKANSTESNLEEPVMHIEDVPAPGICHGKVEEFEEENPDSIDYSGYSGNNRLPPAEETKNKGKEAGGECVNYQAMVQQAEIWSPAEQDTNHVMDKVAPPIQDSDWGADCGPAGEVIEEVIDEEHLSKHTDVTSDDHSPQFDEQEVEIEQKEENVVTCNQEDVVILSLGADQEKEKMLTSDNSVSCSGECDSSSVTPPCLSVPLKAASHDDSESGITTDAKAQISGIADFPDLSVDCQQPQKEDEKRPSLDEDTDCTIFVPGMPSHETENPESNGNGTTMVLAKEYNDQVFDPHIPSCPKDQQSDCMENNETFDETRVNSTTDAPACDNATITSPIMSEEIFHLDMLSSSQDQQSDQTKNNEDFSEVTTGAALVTTKDISPPMCQIHLLSFGQSELRDNDISSPGLGEESGISSMAVSPDLQNPGNEFDVSIENKVLPVMDCDLWSEGKTEAQNSLFADEVAISLINKDTAGFVFGTYTSHHSQASHSEHKDLTGYESFAANEDMFGHEVEDGYHKAMDQFTAEITASLTSFTTELKMQTAMKAFVEVVQIKEKKAGVSVEKKEEAEAEKEKEEDYEKTEISIMEATMDNNEWITDCNYQVLPWMNLSTPTFPQDHTKNNQLPTEECQYSSAVTDTTCLNTPDIHPSTEVKQTSTLSLGDANTENNKKVVAVQPMPQNVNVTFRVHYFTQSPYQTVAVTGNQQELGNWKEFIPLERAKNGHWATVVSLPAESNVEWKFVVLDKGEVCRWEECGNRLLDTGCGDDLLVHKWWGLL